MARAKKQKRKTPKLWVGRDTGSSSVVFYRNQPKKVKDPCDSCGGERDVFNGNVIEELGYDLCEDGFTRMTGIVVKEGEAIQLKVTRVEE